MLFCDVSDQYLNHNVLNFSFHEEDMEYEEFADECRDLTQWMNEVEVTLAQRDPSPADEDGLQHQLEKIKVGYKLRSFAPLLFHHPCASFSICQDTVLYTCLL